MQHTREKGILLIMSVIMSLVKVFLKIPLPHDMQNIIEVTMIIWSVVYLTEAEGS